MRFKFYVIIIFMILLLFGCESKSESSLNIVNKPVDEIEEIYSFVVVDDVYSVQEDYFQVFEYEATESSDLIIDISSKSSVNFEILIFDKVGYLQYEQNETENTEVYLQEIVAANGSLSKTIPVKEGKYYFVVDNTDFGLISPPFNFVSDDVIFELILTLEHKF